MVLLSAVGKPERYLPRTCRRAVAGDDLGEFHMVQLQRHEELIEEVGADAITSD